MHVKTLKLMLDTNKACWGLSKVTMYKRFDTHIITIVRIRCNTWHSCRKLAIYEERRGIS